MQVEVVIELPLLEASINSNHLNDIHHLLASRNLTADSSFFYLSMRADVGLV